MPLRCLLDPRWRREELHAFAGPQAEAILPAVQTLLANRLGGHSTHPPSAVSITATAPPPGPRDVWERAERARADEFDAVGGPCGEASETAIAVCTAIGDFDLRELKRPYDFMSGSKSSVLID